MTTTEFIELRACVYCISGLHEECGDPAEREDGLFECCCAQQVVEFVDIETSRGPGRPLLPVDQITDITSTGRKRAAALYPIFPGQMCEWAGLKNAGGGVYPIIGCKGNTIAEARKSEDLPEGVASRGDRHHGPDKNVLNNAPSNLHRICSYCHNRWHFLNNPTYKLPRPPAGEPWLPEGDWQEHDPVTKATDEEIEQNEEFWSKKKISKVDTSH